MDLRQTSLWERIKAFFSPEKPWKKDLSSLSSESNYIAAHDASKPAHHSSDHSFDAGHSHDGFDGGGDSGSAD